MVTRQLFFMIVSLSCIWLILDEFYGNKRISAFISGIAGEAGSSLGDGGLFSSGDGGSGGSQYGGR